MTEKGTISLDRRTPLFIVSGGLGSSGEQLARTALAQFEGVDLPVVIIPEVKTVAQLEEAVRRAAQSHGTILHTLVDAELRGELVRIAMERNVFTIDLIGTILSRLTGVLGQEPVGQPGLYRQLRESYFNRVEAIEFTVAHDDGKRIADLELAEIILVGPSRVGKTPLSIYLSVLGWKVANVPLSTEVQPPRELFEVDRRRVIGLLIDSGQLIAHRKRRYSRLGVSGKSNYTDPEALVHELELARLVYRRGGFPAVNTTDRPIEESAEEIIALVKSRINRVVRE